MPQACRLNRASSIRGDACQEQGRCTCQQHCEQSLGGQERTPSPICPSGCERTCVRSRGTTLASSVHARLPPAQLPVAHGPWPDALNWQPVRGLQFPIQACGTLTSAEAPGSSSRPPGPSTWTAPRAAGHTEKLQALMRVKTRLRPGGAAGLGAPRGLASSERMPGREHGSHTRLVSRKGMA